MGAAGRARRALALAVAFGFGFVGGSAHRQTDAKKVSSLTP